MKKVITATVFGSIVACGALYAQVSSAEVATVQEVIPGTKISKVEKGEIDGLYKAYMENGRILYIHPYSKKIIFGDIYNNTGKNLSEDDRRAWQSELSSKKLQDVDYDEIKKVSLSIDWNGGNDKYALVMITDPQCPYCKRAEEFLAGKKASIDYVYSVVVPSHTQAPAMIETILANKDPKTVIAKYVKNQAVDSVKSEKARERYKSMNETARKLGINGTPMFIVIDRTTRKPVQIVEGANINELAKFVD